MSRRTLILARYASCAGNFSEVVDVVLSRIDPGEHAKMSLQQGEFMFHYVAEAGGVIFLCISDIGEDRAKCFAFLNACK